MKIGYLLVLLASVFLLAGCDSDEKIHERDKNEMVIIPMEGWNLTEHKILSFSANKTINYVVVPKVWNPHFKVKLNWVWRENKRNFKHKVNHVSEKLLSLPEYNFYENFCGLKVFFLETGGIMLKTTCESPVLLADSYARCERVELKRSSK